MKDGLAIEQIMDAHIPIERLSYSKKVKGWLADRYGAEQAQAIWRATVENYDSYLAIIPDYGGKRNGHATAIYGSLLIFALYPALPDQPLIRCGTCGNGDACDYLVVGSRNPIASEYETVTDEGGFLVSRRTREERRGFCDRSKDIRFPGIQGDGVPKAAAAGDASTHRKAFCQLWAGR